MNTGRLPRFGMASMGAQAPNHAPSERIRTNILVVVSIVCQNLKFGGAICQITQFTKSTMMQLPSGVARERL